MTITRILAHRTLLALGLSAVALGAVVYAQAGGTPASVKDGVYTVAQATRGGALYEEKCINCHADRMWGQDWPEKSVFDVYDIVKNFMPEDNPGSLSAQQSRDIVAHILRTNKFPTGTKELPESEDDLKKIALAAP